MADDFSYLEGYTGRDEAQAFIDSKIDVANNSITEAESRLTTISQDEQQALTDIKADAEVLAELKDIGWDVESASFDKDKLLNEQVPTDPNLRDLYSDPYTDPLTVSDWALPSGVGDMPPDPDIKSVDTSVLDGKNLHQVDTTPLAKLGLLDNSDLDNIQPVDTSGLDGSNLQGIDTTPLDKLEPTDRSDLDKILSVDTSELDGVAAPDVTGLITPPNDLSLTFTPTEYVGALSDFLSAEIKALLDMTTDDPVTVASNVALDGNTQGIPIVDNSIEQAIYDRAKSRLDRKLEADVEQTNATIQARGFSLPPGALNALISDVQAKHSDAVEDLDNDIIKTRVELEQKRTEYELSKAGQVTDAQYKHDSILVEYEKLNTAYMTALAEVRAKYIDAGTRLEAMLIELHNAEQKLLFEVDKEDVESQLKVYNSKVESAKILSEIFQIEVGVVATKIKADTDYNQSLIEIFKGKLEGSSTEADIAKTRVGADIEIRNADKDLAIEKIKTANEINQMHLEMYKGKAEGYKIDADIAKTRVGADIDTRKGDIELASTRVKSETDYNQALMSLFLGGIDAAKGSVDIERLKLAGKKENADIENMEITSKLAVIQSENARLATLANVYESDVRAYASRMEGLKTAETMDLTRYEIESKGKATEIRTMIDTATAAVDAAVKAASLQIEAMKSDASMSASIISAALNSTNMSASFGYKGSAGVSGTRTTGVHYDYSYSGAAEDVGNPNKI